VVQSVDCHYSVSANFFIDRIPLLQYRAIVAPTASARALLKQPGAAEALLFV
jgi:hypothetical protein